MGILRPVVLVLLVLHLSGFLFQNMFIVNGQSCGKPLTKENAPFCYKAVTWGIHMESYARDVTGPDNVAKAYYEGKVATLGKPSARCLARLRQVACGRMFLLCVSDKAPHVQLCNMVCKSAIKECGKQLDFSDEPCRLDNNNCHAQGANGAQQNRGVFLAALLCLMSLVTFLV